MQAERNQRGTQLKYRFLLEERSCKGGGTPDNKLRLSKCGQLKLKGCEPIEGPGGELTLSNKGKLLNFFWYRWQPVAHMFFLYSLSAPTEPDFNRLGPTSHYNSITFIIVSTVSEWTPALRWTDRDVVEGLKGPDSSLFVPCLYEL